LRILLTYSRRIVLEIKTKVVSQTKHTLLRFQLSSLNLISFVFRTHYYYSQSLLFHTKEIPTIKKPEILYYVLQCLNTMALHGDALAKAAREQRGFFIWCQENLLIKK